MTPTVADEAQVPGDAHDGRDEGDAVTFELLPADALTVHEQVEADRTAELAETLRADGYIQYPVVVEQEHRIILDGHHRYHALLELGCVRIPVHLVDYRSPDIRVTLWDGAPVNSVSKEDVVRAGLEGKPFPPKTTRHLFEMELPVRRVALGELSG